MAIFEDDAVILSDELAPFWAKSFWDDQKSIIKRLTMRGDLSKLWRLWKVGHDIPENITFSKVLFSLSNEYKLLSVRNGKNIIYPSSFSTPL